MDEVCIGLVWEYIKNSRASVKRQGCEGMLFSDDLLV